MKLIVIVSPLLFLAAASTAPLPALQMQPALAGHSVSPQPYDSLSGEVKKFYKSGKLQEVAHYANGLREGLTLNYDKKGGLVAERPYKAGRLNGMCKWLLPEREVIWQVDYRDGVRHGKRLYFKKGHKLIESDFVMGQIDGWAYQYHKNGSISLKCYFRAGVLISSEDEYDEEGRLLSKGYPGKVPNHIALVDKYDHAGNKVKSTFVDYEAVMFIVCQKSMF